MIKKNEMDSILRELSFEVNFVNFETSENLSYGGEWFVNTHLKIYCDDQLTGFKAAVYEKQNVNGIKTVVIAFGCNNQDFGDIISVFQYIAKLITFQEVNADNLFTKECRLGFNPTETIEIEEKRVA